MKITLPFFISFVVLLAFSSPVTAEIVGPNSQASNLTFYADKNATTISFLPGDGSIGRAVFITAAATGTPAPVDGTFYTPNTTFGAGAQIGTSGWYCVSQDTYINYQAANGRSTVIVTGLQVGVTYRVAVVECYISGNSATYSALSGANNPANVTPSVEPTIAASNLTFSNTSATATTVNATIGNGSGRAVFFNADVNAIMPLPVNGTSYKAGAVFGTGNQVGNSGWYCVANSNSSSFNVSGLNPGSSYRVAVLEYRSYPDGINYTTANGINNPTALTLSPVPPVQASNLVFSGTTPTGTSVAWTNGNGTARAVFVAATASGLPAPANGTSYLPNPAFGSGSQIGNSGWYCVYDGTGNSTSITGFTPGQTYRIAVIEHATAATGEQYATSAGTNNPLNVTAQYAAPTIQASNIIFNATYAYTGRFSLTPGNGTARAVFIAAATNGSPAPVNGTTYAANDTFGAGSQIGSSGWYCIYNGAGTPSVVNGLSQGTTYRLAVIEYNRAAGSELYAVLPASGNPVNYTTAAATMPTVAAASINFTNVTTTTTTINWTNGNGSQRAVFMLLGNGSGTPSPVNGVAYTANSTFGSGAQIGTTGWYCVANGNITTPVTVSGLAPGTSYRVAVIEYNGATGSQTYATLPGTANPALITIPSKPTLAASNITFAATTGTGTTVNWINGNGTGRAVFITKAATGSPAPVDGTAYTANSVYGAGSSIGTSGWYCIANTTNLTTTASVSGLTTGQTYRVAVIEYSGTGSTIAYTMVTEANNPANFTAVTGAPATAATINIVTPGPFRATLNIVPGSGSAQAIFVATAATGSPVPVNGTAYTAGTYGSGGQIGTSGWYCVYNGPNAASVVIKGLAAATNYRVAVVAYNVTPGANDQIYLPVNGNTNNNPVNFTTAADDRPTTQASNVALSNRTSTSAVFNFTSGNGTGHSVFVALASVNGFPQPEYGTFYPAYNRDGSTETGTTTEGLYGKANSQIGNSGWYCVNNIGTAFTPAPITIYGLTPGTAYKVAVVTYNGFQRLGTSGAESYLTTAGTNNPTVFNTLGASAPLTPASSISAGSITTTTAMISWVNGNGSKRAVFITTSQAEDLNIPDSSVYLANNTYAAGTTIGTSKWYCIYNGSGAFAPVNGLSASTNYRVAVVEYNDNSGVTAYGPVSFGSFTSASNPPPTIQASNLAFTNTTISGTTISWTNGNGTARAVFVSAAATGMAPAVNGTNYTADAMYGSGTQLAGGNWFCVYNGTGTTVNVTGLSPDITYKVAVVEYNKSNAIDDQSYNVTAAAGNPAMITTPGAPTVMAANITATAVTSTSANVSWTNGNGSGRAVFVTLGNASYPTVTNGSLPKVMESFDPFIPVSAYANWYCVYVGTDNFTILKGLYPGTVFRVAVVEYNSGPGNVKYLTGTGSNNPISIITAKQTVAAAGATTIIKGGSVTLSSNYSTNNNTYAWRKNGTIIPDAYDKQSINVTEAGSYTVGIPQLTSGEIVSDPITVSTVFALPSTNFKLTNTAATCKGSNNGGINITAEQNLSYTATVTNSTGSSSVYPFTTSIDINNLAAGSYNICLTVAEQPNYQQCFTSVIAEPKDLSVYTSVIKATNEAIFSLAGGDIYHITVNGVTTTATSGQVTLPLKTGSNHVIVTTDKDCQGVYTDNLQIATGIAVFPNPFVNTINLNLGNEIVNKTLIQVYDSFNNLVYSTSYIKCSGIVKMNMPSVKTGVYIVKLSADDKVSSYKVIKN